jgi:predicted Zn-ribbon and HTH transcriptional regulator
VRGEARRRVCAAFHCQDRELESRIKSLQGNTQSIASRLLQRLEDLQQGIGPHCTGCGYDLTMNQSGRCPECGTAIAPEFLKRLDELGPRTAAPPGRRVSKAMAAFAEVLTLSNQLSREIQRDRRFVR